MKKQCGCVRKKTGMEVSPSTWLVGETEAPGHDELGRPWRSLQGIGSACQPQNQAKPGPCWWAESAFPSFISINIYWYSRCDGFYGRPWGCRNGRDIISTLEMRLVGREKRRPVYLRNCGTQTWLEPERDVLAGMVKSCVLGLIALQSRKCWSCKHRDLSSIPRTQVKNARRRLGTGKVAQPLGAHAPGFFVGGLGLIPSAHTMAHSRL